MKKRASQLVRGDVVASGEVVLSVVHGTTQFLEVTLKNTKRDTLRIATWKKHSTIFLKKVK